MLKQIITAQFMLIKTLTTINHSKRIAELNGTDLLLREHYY